MDQTTATGASLDMDIVYLKVLGVTFGVITLAIVLRFLSQVLFESSKVLLKVVESVTNVILAICEDAPNRGQQPLFAVSLGVCGFVCEVAIRYQAHVQVTRTDAERTVRTDRH